MLTFRSLSYYGAITLLLAILSGLMGCQIGPCGTPTVLLPVILVASGTTAIHDALENQPQQCNTDFILSGEIVDEQGRPIDSLQANVTVWMATRRKYGQAVSWDRRIEEHTLTSNLLLSINHGQFVDITVGGKGLEDQRMILAYGPGFPWDMHQLGFTPTRGNVASAQTVMTRLPDGITFFQIPESNRPTKVSNLHLILRSRPETLSQSSTRSTATRG